MAAKMLEISGNGHLGFWVVLVFDRNLPLMEPNQQKTFQVNTTIRFCITVRKTKSKMSAWRPFWMLGSNGFRKEPSSS
jgi:hypothetical protein